MHYGCDLFGKVYLISALNELKKTKFQGFFQMKKVHIKLIFEEISMKYHGYKNKVILTHFT